MSYERYREWVQGLDDKRLNAELAANLAKRNRQKRGTRAWKAWNEMYERTVLEAQRRDNPIG